MRGLVPLLTESGKLNPEITQMVDRARDEREREHTWEAAP
jgi:hypothetical protein